LPKITTLNPALHSFIAAMKDIHQSKPTCQNVIHNCRNWNAVLDTPSYVVHSPGQSIGCPNPPKKAPHIPLTMEASRSFYDWGRPGSWGRARGRTRANPTSWGPISTSLCPTLQEALFTYFNLELAGEKSRALTNVCHLNCSIEPFRW
jgi:hypothetical protein